MHRHLSACLVAGVVVGAWAGSPAHAQWTVSGRVPEGVPASVAAQPAFYHPEVGTLVRVDWAALDAVLAGAPDEEGVGTDGAWGAPITLPMPDGSVAPFRVALAHIMDPALEAQFPSIRAYRVRGVADASAVGALDVTSHGLRAMIRSASGTVFLDPYAGANREWVSSYYLHEQHKHDDGPQWECHVGVEHGEGAWTVDQSVVYPSPQDSGGFTQRGPGVGLRTYRWALACTGEYGAFQSTLAGHAPNATDAMSAIVTVANRTNVVFEADLGVRGVLVATNNLIAFYDPATDGYPDPDPTCTSDPSADCSGPYLAANATVLNSVIGNANFDVGHVMTRVRGGVASLRAPCGNNKARGVSGIPRGGDVDPVSALVVMHEMGHQFGANHTFGGNRGRCAGNINLATAWEPGSGSSLLAYPGGCPVGGPLAPAPNTDNIAIFASPYFHTGSINEMRAYLALPASQCSVTLPGTNLPPTITTAQASPLFVPPGTPFLLSLIASDDGPTLLANWDAMDQGPGITINDPDNGESALFRSIDPSPLQGRYFPRWSDIIGVTATPGERLPTVTGVTREFRCTLRDNFGGVTLSDMVQVQIPAGSSAFAVTSPTTGVRVDLGSSMTISWSVGGTSGAPFNAANLNVYITPTGLSPTFTFLATVPNTGSAVVSVPATFRSNEARVLITPASVHKFFAVSQPFLVQPPCDSIDFNNDGLYPDTADIDDFLSVFGGGPCSTGNCGDIDFKNDGLFPDTADIDALLQVFSGGACPA